MMGNSCGSCQSCCPQPPPPQNEDPKLRHEPEQTIDRPFQPVQQGTVKPPHAAPLKFTDPKQEFRNIVDADITDPSELAPLVRYIDDLLTRIKTNQSSASTSASKSGAPGLSESIDLKFTSNIMEKISSEVEKVFGKSKEESMPKEEIKRVAKEALNAAGNLHWVAVGFSVVAYVLERVDRVLSNSKECISLLESMTFLAKRLPDLNELMPRDTEEIKKIVHTIVEGATTCCYYMLHGNSYRYAVANTMEASLRETRKDVEGACRDLQLLISENILKATVHRAHPLQNTLLEIEPEGIEDQVAKVSNLLEIEGSTVARAVIIYGFGGCGKTTLGRTVVSKLNLTGYNLSVVKIVEGKSDVCALQNKIISDLGGGNIEVTDDEQGREQISKVLKRQSSFIFIDNVVNKEDIRNLLPKNLSQQNQLEEKKKLRILITSRHRDVKQELFNTSCDEYRVDALGEETCKKILRNIILENHDEPCKEELDQIDAVAVACRGIPLLLEVYGKHLKGDRTRDGAYKEALEYINKGEHDTFIEERLSERLLYVYEKMKDTDTKEAFLDVCMYFQDSEWDFVSSIVGERHLNKLENAALVKNNLSKVIVHDVLKAMGVRRAEGTRLKSRKDLECALKNKQDLKHIKGIWLVDRESVFTLKAEDIDSMEDNLRVLVLGDWIRIDGQCSAEFSKLRFLNVSDLHPFPFKYTSNRRSSLRQLTVLHDQSMGAMEWAELPVSLKHIKMTPPADDMFVPPPTIMWKNTKDLKHLRKFEFYNFKLRAFPEKFELPTVLEELDLTGCRQLQELPNSFGRLTKLQKLTLDDCRSLTILPDQYFSKLSSLKLLSMSRCENLIRLPENFGQLSSLEHLNLSYCGNLQELPTVFGQLSSLQSLSLTDCQSLRELPYLEQIAKSLKEIDISGCRRLKRLPEDFGKLSLLQSLDLADLTCLIELPAGFGTYMNSLAKLTIRRCHSLTSLPCSFGNLSSLKSLEINDCIKLGTLPIEISQLKSLELMTLKFLASVERLPEGLGGTSLNFFWISNCVRLLSLPSGLWQLKFLRYLYLQNCVKLERLPTDFEGLSSLRVLGLEGCKMLEGETMKRLVKLECLCWTHIGGSDKLIEQWKQMRRLNDPPLLVTDGEVADASPVESTWKIEYCRVVGARLMDGRCRLVDCNGQSIHFRDFIEPFTTVRVFKLRSDSSPEELENLGDNYLLSESTEKIISFQEADCFEDININASQNNLPPRFHAIPSTDIKSRILLTLIFGWADPGSGIQYLDFIINEEGRICLAEAEVVPGETSTSVDTVESASENPSQGTAGYGELLSIHTAGQFTNHLEKNGVEHFIAEDGANVKVDSQLHAVFICELNSFEVFNLLKLYTDLRRGLPDFQAVWMPSTKGWNGSLGSYERARACLPWLTLPDPTSPVAGLGSYSSAILSDDYEGMIHGEDLRLVLRCGADAYPFTKAKMEEMKRKELSDMQHRSSLEFILGGRSCLDYGGNKVSTEFVQGKVILLYAGCTDMQFEPKLNGVYRELKEKKAENFDIIYVGCNDHYHYNVTNKDMQCDLHMAQRMPWLRLSSIDMITFWFRYRSLFRAANSHLVEASNWLRIRRLLSRLYEKKKKIPSVLLLFDGDGELLTGRGEEVVELLCNTEGNDEEQKTWRQQVIEGMKTGKFSETLKIKLMDEIVHPKHPVHPLIRWYISSMRYRCNVCGREDIQPSEEDNRYRCQECDWDSCGLCSGNFSTSS